MEYPLQSKGPTLSDVTGSALAAALRDRYVLERELGRGGMATVYLAHDLKHDRKVALKVLHPDLAAVLGRERFLAEIRLTARLDHPHILTLIDSGESNGLLWYVVPFIRGESLRQKLQREKQLGVEEALAITKQVAGALEYAHLHGVIHRDLKPENILLHEGEAMLADFGIALAVKEAGGNRLTETGLSLGTPQYMSPEQATGDRQLDARSDVYSLGAVLYEMLAGEPPHTGATVQAVIAKLMTERPTRLKTVRDTVPEGVDAAVARALAKVPADRFSSAAAFVTALARPELSTHQLPIGTKRARVRRWLAAAAVLLGVGAAVVLALGRGRHDIRLGRRVQLTLDPGLEIDPELSPDGAFVAFAAGPLLRTRLFVRQVDGGTPVAITPEGTGFARVPRWSPDGRRLVFRSERGLEVIPALGGASRLLIARPPAIWLDAAWSPDGKSLVFTAQDSVYVREVEGGDAHLLTRLPEAHSCAWSPDGRWLACVSGNQRFVTNEEFGNIAASSVWLVPAAGGAPVQVSEEHTLNISPAWLPGGAGLLYISNRDGGRDIYHLRLTRHGRPAEEVTRLTTGLNAAHISVTTDGRRLVYAAMTESSNVWSLPISSSRAASVSRAQPVTTGAQIIEWFDISPDDQWLAFDSDRGGTQQIYRAPLTGGARCSSSRTVSSRPSSQPSRRTVGRSPITASTQAPGRSSSCQPRVVRPPKSPPEAASLEHRRGRLTDGH